MKTLIKDKKYAVILHRKDGSTDVTYFEGLDDAERYWFDKAKYRAKIDKIETGLITKLEAQVNEDWEMHRWNNYHYQTN